MDESLAALRWSRSDPDPRLPPARASVGTSHLILAVRHRERLARLDYDFDRLPALMVEAQLVSLHLVWQENPLRYSRRMTRASLRRGDEVAGTLKASAGFSGGGRRGCPVPASAKTGSGASVAWLVLVVAGLLEVAWASVLPSTDGLTRPAPTVAFVALLIASMLALARATESIPVGTAYAVWVGIGAVGGALVGIAVHDDPATPARLAFLMLLVAAIVGLKVTSGR